MRVTLHRHPEIEVVDVDGVIGVYSDGDCQGRAKIRDGIIEPISRFYDLVTTFIGFLPAKPSRILYIGGGACIVPTFMYQTYGVAGTIVEPNAFMIDIAINTFRLNRAVFDVSKMDGLSFLRSYENKYAVILLDAFNGFTPDNGLYSWEGYTLCKQHLNPGGMFISNYIDGSVEKVQQHGMVLGSVFKNYGGSNIDRTVPHQCVMWASDSDISRERKEWTRHAS